MLTKRIPADLSAGYENIRRLEQSAFFSHA